MLSFLEQVFIAEKHPVHLPPRSSRVGWTTSFYALERAAFNALNERLGEHVFPKPAKAYLDDWAAPETGWLRLSITPRARMSPPLRCGDAGRGEGAGLGPRAAGRARSWAPSPG